jgi:hypothetical protein
MPQYRPQAPAEVQPAPAPSVHILSGIPPSVPVDEDENVDHIALKAAIYTLQKQREKAAQDIRTLQRIKAQAMANPVAWLEQHATGQDRRKRSKHDVLGGTFEDDEDEMEELLRRRTEREDTGDMQDKRGGEHDEAEEEDGVEQDQHEDEAMPDKGAPYTAKDDAGRHAIPEDPDIEHQQIHFDKMPSRQRVIRMPAVNWAKYHVVGHALDRLHEEQRRRPTAGEPATIASLNAGGRTLDFQVAAPYDPLKDVIDAGRGGQGQGQAVGYGGPVQGSGQGGQPYHPMTTRRSSTRNG